MKAEINGKDMKHTKGNWKLDTVAHCHVRSESGRSIANTGVYNSNINQEQVEAENLANAKLIAAAPELLEALQNIVSINGVGYGTNVAQFVTDLQPLISDAEEAIKKATEL